MQLQEFPDDILGIIFKQIPYWKLNQIKDIPQIKRYVLSQLYISISVNTPSEYLDKFKFPDEVLYELHENVPFVKHCQNNQELIEFLTKNPFF